MSIGEIAKTNPKGSIPISSSTNIVSGRRGDRRWWRVAGNRIELSPAGSGWDAKVERSGWGGLALEIDGPGGHFDDEAEALAWCERMAEVLAQDAEDDLDAV